jgi:hypothetical protein
MAQALSRYERNYRTPKTGVWLRDKIIHIRAKFFQIGHSYQIAVYLAKRKDKLRKYFRAQLVGASSITDILYASRRHGGQIETWLRWLAYAEALEELC